MDSSVMTGRHFRAGLMGLAVGLIVLVFAEWLIRLEAARVDLSAQTRLQAQASVVRARLESELSNPLSIGQSVAAFVAANPQFRAQDYERLADTLFALQPRLRNIALAPDHVIRHVYPLNGNERALGTNLEQLAEQREVVLRVARERQPVTAGPLNLVQGGLGIVNRVPVQILGADGHLHYWGQVAVVIDPLPIFAGVGLNNHEDVLYALRGRDAKGKQGEVFLGPENLFAEADSLQQEIAIPGGHWVLAARWRDPATAKGWHPLPWHLLAILLALASGSLAAYAMQSQQRLAVLASHDSLTGLANRHRFIAQAQGMLALAERQRRPAVMLSVDLEDFKCINDDFGHETGDAMLVHVAGQARGCLRASDLIARFGGDEFLVLLPDTDRGEQLDMLLARLHEAVSVPLQVGERTLRVGMSIGIAAFPDDGATLEALMRAADASMYENKRRRGRSGAR
ncbi:MAG: diguanylate cyclase [Moraxellaceae bacterium]|nr:diguanylate cyclase [Moraxellaceae bacterium]